MGLLHALIVHVLNVYKWLEKALLTIFSSRTEAHLHQVYKSCGLKINGKNPWDPKVHNRGWYSRVASQPSLGLGESFMDGWWDVDDLEEMMFRMLRGNIHRHCLTIINRIHLFLMFQIVNLQTKARAWMVGEQHYDNENDVIKSMIGQTLNYTCGYWAKNAKNLDEAQTHKMELIAQKLKLKPGMKVLDIGCGWGGLCKYLAEKHGVSVVGITIGKEGAKIARDICTGLPVDIREMDYRDMNEKFDRIVSVGMFEHVGEKNYKSFFEISHQCLTEDGILLLHTIGINHHDFVLTEPWTHKYIFPNGMLPYIKHIPKYSEGLFILEDWHNFGNDYSKTLKAWHKNFLKAWPQLSQTRGEKFFRMWSYYLCIASAGFRSRRFQLWQVVMTKDGILGGYESIR